MATAAANAVVLPARSESQWPDRRYRSDGTLSACELAWCRTNGLEVGFDPVQQGMVRLDSIDDIVDVSTTNHPGSAATPNPSVMTGSGALRFRRWTVADAPRFVALLDDKQVWRHMPDAQPVLDIDKGVDLINLSNEAEHHDVQAVELDGIIVGQARLLFDLAAPVHDTAEVSYWLGQPYWGQGIGSRLVREFTSTSFARWPGVKSIVARVHRENAASMRVLRKAGYLLDPAGTGGEWQWFRVDRAA